MAKYNQTKKSARSSQPPRMGKKKLQQKYVCPCWSFRGRNCPLCRGKAKPKQDPNGPEGSMISDCPICQCTCALGPFKNSDRENLGAAYHDYVDRMESRPTVSDRRDAGLGSLSELTRLAIQVSCLFYFIRDFRDLLNLCLIVILEWHPGPPGDGHGADRGQCPGRRRRLCE